MSLETRATSPRPGKESEGFEPDSRPFYEIYAADRYDRFSVATMAVGGIVAKDPEKYPSNQPLSHKLTNRFPNVDFELALGAFNAKLAMQSDSEVSSFKDADGVNHWYGTKQVEIDGHVTNVMALLVGGQTPIQAESTAFFFMGIEPFLVFEGEGEVSTQTGWDNGSRMAVNYTDRKFWQPVINAFKTCSTSSKQRG